MLKALLPEGRWRLLRALWLDHAKGSIRELARLAEVSYCSAHSELKRLEKAGLACSESVGSASVYRANRDNPVATELEVILGASQDPARQLDDEELLAHLRKLGAPVLVDSEPSGPMPAEEAVARGLCLAHRMPALARAFPVLLARNRARLDFARLRHRATALGEKQTLGFLLDLTGLLAKDNSLRSLAQSLKDRRVSRIKDFFDGPHGQHAARLAEMRTPPIARDWKFRMDMSMESFEQLFDKFWGAP
jgi:DNA-binding transcriptional ArsR family regulator